MSHQLQSFRVVAYRALDGLEIPRLAPRVNLITGRNAAGKTSLLEAIWLFYGRFDPARVWNENVRRSPIVAFNPVMELATDRIELEGEEGGRTRHLRLEFFLTINEDAWDGSDEASVRAQGVLEARIDGKELDLQHGGGIRKTAKGPVLYPLIPPPLGRGQAVIEGCVQHPLFLNEELIGRYSRTVRERKKPQILHLLSVLDPGLVDVEILKDERDYQVWVTAADESFRPLYELGGGMVRLFRLAVSLAAASDGVLLVDEIENGLHHSVLVEFWKRLNRMASAANVQVFAATHSHECIDAAITAFGEESSELAVHGLYRANGDGPPEATFFTGPTLAAARDLNFELR